MIFIEISYMDLEEHVKFIFSNVNHEKCFWWYYKPAYVKWGLCMNLVYIFNIVHVSLNNCIMNILIDEIFKSMPSQTCFDLEIR